MLFYHQKIVAATRCDMKDAPTIETMMRDHYRNLAEISADEFVTEARQCNQALRYLREKRPRKFRDVMQRLGIA